MLSLSEAPVTPDAKKTTLPRFQYQPSSVFDVSPRNHTVVPCSPVRKPGTPAMDTISHSCLAHPSLWKKTGPVACFTIKANVLERAATATRELPPGLPPTADPAIRLSPKSNTGTDSGESSSRDSESSASSDFWMPGHQTFYDLRRSFFALFTRSSARKVLSPSSWRRSLSRIQIAPDKDQEQHESYPVQEFIIHRAEVDDASLTI